MFILCHGKMATKPYRIPFGKYSVYSLEELCYAIYHNIYSVTEELLTIQLVDWLENETDNHELAHKLRKMMRNGTANLKDIVVTILCTADYYNEKEMRELVCIMDEIEHLPLYEKKKIKADNYLRQGHYGKAAASYRKLLNGSFAVNFSTEEYGNILHNKGIADFYISSFHEAARDFKEAYVRNHNEKSLEHYLYILCINKEEEAFFNEGMALGKEKEELQQIKVKVEHVRAKQQNVQKPDDFLLACKEELRKAFAL